MEDKNTIRQVIIMRKFKGIRSGKYLSQACHGSIAFLTNALRDKRDLTEVEQSWVDNAFTKICLVVETEEELDRLYEEAKKHGIQSHLIIDNGLTEFNGVKTKTCLALGPDYKDKIDLVTAGLPLF